ncbi:MAG: hypothetical protein PGN13_09340 [Patulibacter minatonensis]
MGETTRRVPARWSGALAALLSASAVAAAGAQAAGSEVVVARTVGNGDTAMVTGGSSGLGAAAWLERTGKRTALRTAIVRDGRLTGRQTVVSGRRDRMPAVVGITVDARGTQRLLFGDERRGEHLRLRLVERRGTGAWSRPVTVATASVGGMIEDRVEAGIATHPSGRTVVIWCEGGQARNVLDTRHPGTIRTRVLHGGRWSAARRLWKGQFCSATSVQTAPDGFLAEWFGEPVELEDSPHSFARADARGRFGRPHGLQSFADAGTAQMHAAPIAGGSLLLGAGPLPTDDGRLIRVGTASARGLLTADAVVPMPSAEQTQGGWVGAGGPIDVVGPVGTPAQSTVVYATAEGRRDGGADIGGIWAATGSAAAGWSVAAVDPFAAAGPSGAANHGDGTALDLDELADGTPVATWGVGSGAPCTVQYFQSMRGASGWGPRTLVAERRTASQSCQADTPRALPDAGLIEVEAQWARSSLWATVSGRGAAPAPVVQLRTTTWNAVRRAGALELTCAVPGGGVCHVSLVPRAAGRRCL